MMEVKSTHIRGRKTVRLTKIYQVMSRVFVLSTVQVFVPSQEQRAAGQRIPQTCLGTGLQSLSLIPFSSKKGITHKQLDKREQRCLEKKQIDQREKYHHLCCHKDC